MSGGNSFRDRVERIVDERIRPQLNMHEGDMRVKEALNGEVSVVLTGKCRTCPSAQITMEEIIAQTLADELKDEFRAVHLVTETDEDLLNFARHLLNKNK